MKVRVTGVLIEEDHILLLDQDVENTRSWSLPGGTVEEHESLEHALIREMKEETGLDVRVGKLLYICDFLPDNKHVIHLTFLVHRLGGNLGQITEGVDTNKIRNVTFIPVSQLHEVGFSEKFESLVANGFPEAGNYMGAKSNIGL